MLATAEAPLRDFEAQAIDGGYVLSGMDDSGMMVYIYDSSLPSTAMLPWMEKPSSPSAAGIELPLPIGAGELCCYRRAGQRSDRSRL